MRPFDTLMQYLNSNKLTEVGDILPWGRHTKRKFFCWYLWISFGSSTPPIQFHFSIISPIHSARYFNRIECIVMVNWNSKFWGSLWVLFTESVFQTRFCSVFMATRCWVCYKNINCLFKQFGFLTSRLRLFQLDICWPISKKLYCLTDGWTQSCKIIIVTYFKQKKPYQIYEKRLVLKHFQIFYSILGLKLDFSFSGCWGSANII